MNRHKTLRMPLSPLLPNLVLLVTLMPIGAFAVQLYTDFPATPHADERYVIYSHGLIVEGDDPSPISPKYGQYDFPGIKAALFEGGGFNLIAYQRPKGVEEVVSVALIETWVRRLLDAGVSASRITLVGFSRGAQLTAFAASGLRAAHINTAIMATCEEGDIVHIPPLVLAGNVLSIYESSDTEGSCRALAARGHLDSFKEVVVSTGRGHGTFFQPDQRWMAPLKAWIAATNR
jgi:hypothetical protein